MSRSSYSVNLSANIYLGSTPISPGTCLVVAADGASFAPATAANLAGRSTIDGVAIDSGSPTLAVRMQTDGVITNDVTQLGAGALSYARLNQTTARLERAAVVAPSDIVYGVVNEIGDVIIGQAAMAIAPAKGGGGGGGFTGFLRPQDFGALANGTHDDWAAIQACIDASGHTGSVIATDAVGLPIYFSAGTYRISKPIMPIRQLLYGDGGATTSGTTTIAADVDVTAFFFHGPYQPAPFDAAATYVQNDAVRNGSDNTKTYLCLNTIGGVAGAIALNTTLGSVSTSANGARFACYASRNSEFHVLRDMTITGQKGAGSADGIHCRAPGRFENVGVYNFSGDGFADRGEAAIGTTDESLRLWCHADNCSGSGFHTFGADASASTFLGCGATGNGQHSFWDHSFLGCYWIGCSDNLRGNPPYSAFTNIGAGATNKMAIFGAYVEGNGNCQLYSPAAVYEMGGGEMSSDSTAVRMDANIGSKRVKGADKTNPVALQTYLGVFDGITMLGQQAGTENAASGFAYTWSNAGTTGNANLPNWDDGWHAWTFGSNQQVVSLAIPGSMCKFGLGKLYAPAGILVSDFRGHAQATTTHINITVCTDGVEPTSGLWETGSFVLNSATGHGGVIGWQCIQTGGWGTAWASNHSYTIGEAMSLGGSVYRLKGYGPFWLQSHTYTIGNIVQSNLQDSSFVLDTAPAYDSTANYMVEGYIFKKNTGAENTPGNYYVCTAAPGGSTPGTEPNPWPATGLSVTTVNGFTFQSRLPNVSATIDPSLLNATGPGLHYNDGTCPWLFGARGKSGGVSPTLPTTFTLTGQDGTCLWECAGVDGASNELFAMVGRTQRQGTLTLSATTALSAAQADYELIEVNFATSVITVTSPYSGQEIRVYNSSAGNITVVGFTVTAGQMLTARFVGGGVNAWKKQALI